MQIRRGKAEEIDKIMRIYERARAFMRKNGNATQWDKGYPSRELILKEIEQGCQYVCEEEEAIVAVFSLCGGPDPTYEKIWDGQWLNQSPYHVLHRLASSGERKGAGMFCLQWSIEQSEEIRVDTHEANLPMQRLLEKNGFVKCGKIQVADGTERIAFQLKKQFVSEKNSRQVEMWGFECE